MDTTLQKTNLKSAFTAGAIAPTDYVVVQNGSVDLVYLADRTSPNRFDLLKRMRAQALATEGVQEALYREPNPADGGTANTLAGAHPAWHLEGARDGRPRRDPHDRAAPSRTRARSTTR